jgi:O-antigen/teichoic acid export membrane protein
MRYKLDETGDAVAKEINSAREKNNRIKVIRKIVKFSFASLMCAILLYLSVNLFYTFTKPVAPPPAISKEMPPPPPPVNSAEIEIPNVIKVKLNNSSWDLVEQILLVVLGLIFGNKLINFIFKKFE